MVRAVWLSAVLLLVQPSPSSAWGFAAHRLLMARAIDALPAEVKPFFQQHRDELLLRVVDPDLWRIAGWEDDPNHFLNFGVAEYGSYPFAALPREYGAAVEKFGGETLRRNGLLPWRVAEEFGNLRRAFAGLARGAATNTVEVVLFASVAAHYIQDAYQPLHATVNYDGQQTSNRGIHARFESDLVTRYESRLRLVVPARTTPMTNSRDAAFDALLSSHQAVDALLRADTEALGGGRTYGGDYFEKFFIRVQPILEERLSAASSATAALIVGAWTQAGKPRL